jgi:hypothetical protein
MRYDGFLDDALAGLSPGQTVLFGMDGGGRELVDQQIMKILRRQGRCRILEVGSFVGHSAHRWLSLDPRVELVSSDLFHFDSSYLRNLYSNGEAWVSGQLPPAAAEAFFNGQDLEWGQLRIFLLNLAQFRQRVQVFIGDFAQEAPEIAAACGPVDLVYLDADKGYDTLLAAHRYFPEAGLLGDDWEFRDDSGFPIQEAVHRFCHLHGYRVTAHQATWVLMPCSPLRLRDRLRGALGSVRSLMVR